MEKKDALVAITLMTAVLPAAQAFGQQTFKQQTDPLINKGEEVTVYVGTFLLVIAIAAVIGMLSRRIEHAVFIALAFSLIPIVFFFFTR